MALKLFSNVLAYRLDNAFELHKDLEAINNALASKPARLPGKMELNAVGFTEPVGEEGQFIQRVAPMAYMFAYCLAERMIPGKIVRQQVQARVKKIEKEEERKVYAREKQQLKDAVLQEMLPRAFIDQKITYAMVMGPYILIDSSSAKRGEDVLSALREVLGTLGVRPVTVKTTPIDAYTRWFIAGRTGNAFHLTGDFKADNKTDESDSLNGKGTDPETEGLSDLVAEHNRRVTVLGLTWPTSTGETARFTVNEMIGIKGIKWPESLSEMAASEVSQDDEEEARRVTLIRATMTLLAAELKSLLEDLLPALGGETTRDGQEAADEDLTVLTLRRMGEEYMTTYRAKVVPPAEEEDDDLVSQLPDDDGDDSSGGSEAYPLYGEAVAFVRKTKRASISAIQRHLKLGYNRAARMIEQMEEDGIVTPMNSNGAREVIAASTKADQSAQIRQAVQDLDELV